jgi:hypothetical protein
MKFMILVKSYLFLLNMTLNFIPIALKKIPPQGRGHLPWGSWNLRVLVETSLLYINKHLIIITELQFMRRFVLFVYLFWVARKIFELSGDCHHCRVQGCKFRPMFSTYSFLQWVFFYVPHLLRNGTSVFKVISERPVILTSECHALGEVAITTYFKRLRFDAASPSRARTHDLPFDKSKHYY